MAQRDQLQQDMVNDFHTLMRANPKLEAAFFGLPDDEKLDMENRYLEWAWQCIMGAATFVNQKELPEVEVPQFIRAFGGFILSCQQGNTAQFATSDWVAMDRATFDQITPTLKALSEELKARAAES